MTRRFFGFFFYFPCHLAEGTGQAQPNGSQKTASAKSLAVFF